MYYSLISETHQPQHLMQWRVMSEAKNQGWWNWWWNLTGHVRKHIVPGGRGYICLPPHVLERWWNSFFFSFFFFILLYLVISELVTKNSSLRCQFQQKNIVFKSYSKKPVNRLPHHIHGFSQVKWALLPFCYMWRHTVERNVMPRKYKHINSRSIQI